MKKMLILMIGLLVLLPGCRKQVQPAEEAASPAVPQETQTAVPEEPLRIDTLRVELSKSGLDSQTLMAAVKELPELLEGYFAQTDVEVGTVKVTVGASQADTARALADGSVWLGFLTADALLGYGGEAEILLADAREAPDGALVSGTASVICAAPTEYGRQLAARAESGSPLTWTELDKARWGVLQAGSLAGYRSLDLWLADQYEGNRLAELSRVTVYDSDEELLRAAAAGEIDALVLRADAREELAEAWALADTRTDAGGMQGFGRTESIWQEVPVLAETEPLYSQVAAVAPLEQLTDGRFSAALEHVMEQLAREAPERMLTFGAVGFSAVERAALDPTRRLVTIEAAH